jgi:hypothetical protein
MWGHVSPDPRHTGKQLGIFTRHIRKQLWIKGGRISERKKKTHTRLASGLLSLLAKHEFNSHLAINLASGYPNPCVTYLSCQAKL